MPRLNIYASDVNAVRIRNILEKVDFKISNLVEAVALCSSEAELRELKRRYEKAKLIEGKLGGDLGASILARLKGMNESQLEVVLKSIESVETQSGESATA